MDEFQYKRKASLLLVDDDEVLDLSNLRFRFQVKAMDVESPNNAAIRVYNLSRDTLVKIRGEFSRVILQAGYDNNFGVIFDGTIKQFRIGREGTTDTYLDILAADGVEPAVDGVERFIGGLLLGRLDVAVLLFCRLLGGLQARGVAGEHRIAAQIGLDLG